MKQRRCLLLGFLLLFVTAVWAEPSQGLSPKAAQAVDSTIKDFMQAHKLKGVGVGILSRGRISYVQGYGSIHRHAPVDIASLSKPLTAVLALKLAEEGKLDLDAPVTRYLKDLDLPPELTIRTLLSHTSGLPHYNNRFSKHGFGPGAFSRNSLALSPGEGYLYSSPGYVVLSWVVEAVTGASLLDQLNTKLCRPARAQGLVKNPNPRFEWRLGAGGIKASPESMSRLAFALLQRRILSRESYKQMWSPAASVPGKDYSQGLGFRIETKGRVSHGGSHSKEHYYHRLVLYPARGHGMVILTHASSSEAKNKPGKLSSSLYKALKAAGHKL